MKKHNYRTKNVNEINWPELRQQLGGGAVTFAVDVAKAQQYALLTDAAQNVSALVKWELLETTALIQGLQQLGCPVTVVMESTGTYGDAMRHQFRQAGFDIWQASAKRVHDAKEIFDGVPSLHDAKAACLIAKLHKEGLTKPWHELDEAGRALNAARREYDLHQSQYGRNQNRLEAYLGRHWPEVLALFDLDSVTLEKLLVAYGSPQDIAADAEQAAKQLLEACVVADEGLKEMAALIGKLTAAILIGLHLDPRNFSNAQGFLKALGLNLTEKSSGQYHGQLKISKRGSAVARKYLYLAALRLIQRDPVIGEWYRAKADPKIKMKTVIACLRKLAKALWHVARGERFDARKLVTI
ncbi:transposase [Methylovulum psychrotolerans]|uniref:transposase n=1 Tax=Methylovulum psychrotolerans TaxID=1704499 RepID=UPI001BFEF009|nr:transposase [Methylovulum psychrotolerans]MBT9096501.1 transposase [Methylovulum psychrotolerans]MBT9097038.1 transposase [Methylovulum psychrotolerans]MBT9097895.1 transposase [Methylovulum psychrotolerans]